MEFHEKLPKLKCIHSKQDGESIKWTQKYQWKRPNVENWIFRNAVYNVYLVCVAGACAWWNSNAIVNIKTNKTTTTATAAANRSTLSIDFFLYTKIYMSLHNILLSHFPIYIDGNKTKNLIKGIVHFSNYGAACIGSEIFIAKESYSA